jgi:hypothetical protein
LSVTLATNKKYIPREKRKAHLTPRLERGFSLLSSLPSEEKTDFLKKVHQQVYVSPVKDRAKNVYLLTPKRFKNRVQRDFFCFFSFMASRRA